MHGAVWWIVLLTGWLFLRATVHIPWYEASRGVSPARRLPMSQVAEAPEVGALSQGGPPTIPRQPDHVAAPAETDESADFVANWPLILVAAWLTGATVIAGRWLVAYLHFVRHLPRGLPLTDEWQAEWQTVLSECTARPAVQLVMTEDIGPLVFRGLGGYQLLVPLWLWRETTPPERVAILRHEVAHIRRGDVVKSLLASFIALPHWFNPLSWWAVRNLDECGEWACDDAVRRGETAVAIAYSKILLRLGQANNRPMFGAAMGGRRLSTRVKRLLSGALPEDSTMKKFLVMAPVAALLVAAAVDWQLVERESDAAEQEAKGSRLESNVDPAMYREMEETAAKTYEATKASYDMGTEIMANLYVWSRRWLDAERALTKTDAEELAALRAHRERMKKLMMKVRALYATGSKGGEAERFFASKYYLAEADTWLAAAKNRKAQKPGELEKSNDFFPRATRHGGDVGRAQ